LGKEINVPLNIVMKSRLIIGRRVNW
jgi:hypothetical protein